MTAEQLHDALNLLPGDLITAADRVRTQTRRPALRWNHLLSLAACFCILLTGATVILSRLPLRVDKQESAMEMAQSPAAPAPVAPEEEKGVPEYAADEVAPMEPDQEAISSATGSSAHRHSFAQDSPAEDTSKAYCGNTGATVYLDGETFEISGSDAITLTDILENLPYSTETVCRCATEFTVDTEFLTGIQVNLTQGFARCEQGQADLTEEQADAIRAVLDGLPKD